MVKDFFNELLRFFSRGHERSVRAKKNILGSLLINIIQIFIGLILVPISINYLGPAKYGVWVTLSSMIGWFGFFDVGLGNGLRNRFAEARTSNQDELVKIYVSTSYAILTIIVLSFLLVFYSVNSLLNWNSILNASFELIDEEELRLTSLTIFTFVSLSFVFELIKTILNADQRAAMASLFDLIGKLISLITIYILSLNSESSILYIGVVITGIPVLTMFSANIFFFNRKYRAYKPAISFIRINRAWDLMSLGIKFFIIRISAILLYQTNSIIISHLFGPTEVTSYDVAMRYFNLLIIGYSIMISPFWSAFTEAWVKEEKDWIKSTIKKLLKAWSILVLAALFMVIFSKQVYRIWVGEQIVVPYLVSALIAFRLVLITFSSIYSQFLNGVGKVRIQLLLASFASVINIPLTILFGKWFGIEGVLSSNLLISILGFWVYPLQYKKIINGKANGIWSK